MTVVARIVVDFMAGNCDCWNGSCFTCEEMYLLAFLYAQEKMPNLPSGITARRGLVVSDTVVLSLAVGRSSLGLGIHAISCGRRG